MLNLILQNFKQITKEIKICKGIDSNINNEKYAVHFNELMVTLYGNTMGVKTHIDTFTQESYFINALCEALTTAATSQNAWTLTDITCQYQKIIVQQYGQKTTNCIQRR